MNLDLMFSRKTILLQNLSCTKKEWNAMSCISYKNTKQYATNF